MPPSPRTWLGVSPPTRCTGALNPQPRDRRWRSSAQQWSASSLAALREIDARGASFLTPSSQGEAPGGPEAAWHGSLASACSSARSSSSCASRLATPRTCQMGFVLS